MKKIVILFLALQIPSVHAQLSPGKLHRSHAHLEGLANCTRCHLSGRKIASDKCLACHTLIRESMDSGRGYHASVKDQACESCHVEHHGRDFDLVWWGEKGRNAFDHTRTGYPLQGRHASLDCRDCHKSEHIPDPEKYTAADKDLNRTFLGLDTGCLTCHPDEHRGQFSQCTDCHTYEGWKPASLFDHKQTAFPLTGRHLGTDCVKCHPARQDGTVQYTGLNHAACTDCHLDPHEGRLGFACTDCHTTSGWRQADRTGFDHDLTRFPLEGKHRSVACRLCHKGESSLRPRHDKCADCHTDYHQGQMADGPAGGDCAACHTVKGFRPSTYTLANHQESSFPLKGAHLAVPCMACHTKTDLGGPEPTPRFRFASTRCADCHEDVHKGATNRFTLIKSALTGRDGCAHCHTEESWKRITFDHDLTSFPLEGRHRETSCIACHTQRGTRPLTFKPTGRECTACHADVHNGQFAEEGNPGRVRCERCHSTDSWRADKFDHNRDSRFQLTGAHLTLECGDCHQTVTREGVSFVLYRPMKIECIACHGESAENQHLKERDLHY